MASTATAARRPKARRGSYWLYLLPLVAGFVVVVAAPFAMNVYTSLFHWKGGQARMRWAGLENYADLFADATFWHSFQNTIAMIVAITVIPTIIGILLAALLFDYLGRRFGDRAIALLRATYYVPQILPIAVAGFIWAWILDTQKGSINLGLKSLGISSQPDWLGDPNIAIYAVMLMLIWLQIGYPVVIFMSALQRVDPELYEAAELDGAGWWRRFQAITIPQIRPEIFVVVLTATIAALKVFAPILILTGGGPEESTIVPSYYAYRNFFELSRVGYGSTIATVMSVVIFIVATVMLIWQHRESRKEHR
ncbi:carbohydrate ABC transporter permease [Microbacterium murale]|uniref:ABC transporter permease n=1 Tax=Microbacterium murale TaxID=1081040 RepID=A0ABQ1S2T7_9MICO|nr:sugar ABC transporter permease [Microbacterium murale]GGD89153.1 ABC transporter permease [Microbacterium murale]